MNYSFCISASSFCIPCLFGTSQQHQSRVQFPRAGCSVPSWAHFSPRAWIFTEWETNPEGREGFSVGLGRTALPLFLFGPLSNKIKRLLPELGPLTMATNAEFSELEHLEGKTGYGEMTYSGPVSLRPHLMSPWCPPYSEELLPHPRRRGALPASSPRTHTAAAPVPGSLPRRLSQHARRPTKEPVRPGHRWAPPRSRSSPGFLRTKAKEPSLLSHSWKAGVHPTEARRLCFFRLQLKYSS